MSRITKQELSKDLAHTISTAESYNEYSLNKDSNGIYTVAELRRKSDESVFQRSTLSNRNSSGNYVTQVVETFAEDGVTLVKRETYSRKYDTDGVTIERKLISEEVF